MEDTYYMQDRNGNNVETGLAIWDMEDKTSELLTEEDYDGQEGQFLTNEQAVLRGEEYAITWQRKDGTEIVVGYFGLED